MVKLREPVRIVVNDERQAGAVTRELVGLVGLDVHPAEGRWEVTLNCIKTDRLVIRVLDAVRSSLARDPSASALVVLEGREYHIQGTPSATAASEPERGDPPETQLAASGRPRS